MLGRLARAAASFAVLVTSFGASYPAAAGPMRVAEETQSAQADEPPSAADSAPLKQERHPPPVTNYVPPKPDAGAGKAKNDAKAKRTASKSTAASAKSSATKAGAAKSKNSASKLGKSKTR